MIIQCRGELIHQVIICVHSKQFKNSQKKKSENKQRNLPVCEACLLIDGRKHLHLLLLTDSDSQQHDNR